VICRGSFGISTGNRSQCSMFRGIRSTPATATTCAEATKFSGCRRIQSDVLYQRQRNYSTAPVKIRHRITASVICIDRLAYRTRAEKFSSTEHFLESTDSHSENTLTQAYRARSFSLFIRSSEKPLHTICASISVTAFRTNTNCRNSLSVYDGP